MTEPVSLSFLTFSFLPFYLSFFFLFSSICRLPLCPRLSFSFHRPSFFVSRFRRIQRLSKTVGGLCVRRVNRCNGNWSDDSCKPVYYAYEASLKFRAANIAIDRFWFLHFTWFARTTIASYAIVSRVQNRREYTVFVADTEFSLRLMYLYDTAPVGYKATRFQREACSD